MQPNYSASGILDLTTALPLGALPVDDECWRKLCEYVGIRRATGTVVAPSTNRGAKKRRGPPIAGVSAMRSTGGRLSEQCWRMKLGHRRKASARAGQQGLSMHRSHPNDMCFERHSIPDISRDDLEHPHDSGFRARWLPENLCHIRPGVASAPT